MTKTMKIAVLEKMVKFAAQNFAFKPIHADKNVLGVLLEDGMIEKSTFQQGSQFLKCYILTEKGKNMVG